jgi:hypothetical protein
MQAVHPDYMPKLNPEQKKHMEQVKQQQRRQQQQ